MSCFCKVPVAQTAATMSSFQFRMTPPIAPIQMRLAAAFGLAMEPNRADVRISLALSQIRLPNITVGDGSLMSLALNLKLAGGTFTFDDIPMLEFQMRQAAESVRRNVWPHLSFLTSIPLLPLLNLAIIARLQLTLIRLNIDPVNVALGGPPPAASSSTWAFALTPPMITKMNLVLGLPRLLTLHEILKIPIGEQNAAQLAQNRLALLANLQLPTLGISIPMMLRIAFALEAMVTIRAAFGPDAMTPDGLSRIAATLQTWMRLSLPIPMPAIALSEQLALLPPMDDIVAGSRAATAPPSGFSFTPPTLRIAPFLNAVVALNTAMQLYLEVPVMDQCSACNAIADAASGAFG